MDTLNTLNTDNLLKGTFLFAGAYLVARAGRRVYQSLTAVPQTQEKQEPSATKQLLLSETCSLSMGILGTVLLFSAYEASRHN